MQGADSGQFVHQREGKIVEAWVQHHHECAHVTGALEGFGMICWWRTFKFEWKADRGHPIGFMRIPGA